MRSTIIFPFFPVERDLGRKVLNPIVRTSKAGAEQRQAANTLAAAQARILLKANLRNIAKKVQAGGTLSMSERNLLESAAGGVASA